MTKKQAAGLKPWEKGLSSDVLRGRRASVDARVFRAVAGASGLSVQGLEECLDAVPASEVRASMERLIDSGQLRVDRRLLLRTGEGVSKPKGGKASPTHCLCGRPLPLHFLGIADFSYSHVCSCGRSWAIVGDRFVLRGKEPNPVAAHDRAQAKGRRKAVRGSHVRDQCEDVARRLVREASLEAAGPLASITNPLYTGVAGYPALVTDEEFVRVSTKLIQAVGPEFYLFQLLRELKAGLGGDWS